MLTFQLKRLQHLVSPTCAVWGLHCRAEGSHLATDHLFGPLKQHSGIDPFKSNEKVEMAIREWSRM
jgi:hypothetical protein